MKSYCESRDRKLVTQAGTQVTIGETAMSVTPSCLYRLEQVLARIPVSRSAWLKGIKTGRYPRGVHLAPRTIVWHSEDIDHVIGSLKGVAV